MPFGVPIAKCRRPAPQSKGCRLLAAFCLLFLILTSGCQNLVVRGQGPDIHGNPVPAPGVAHYRSDMPSEMEMTALPEYRIEPPDILLIEAIKVVPKPPYELEPQDILQIVAAGALLEQPISGRYTIDPSGRVDLGPAYGKVYVRGMTTEQATVAIEKRLRRILQQPQVSVTLLQAFGQQPIFGEYLVAPDGSVNLGLYGKVYVTGMTLAEAKLAVEAQLSKFLAMPRVSIDVAAYNSKMYYIITEGAGFGDQLIRAPITGNETVLDALAQINGLTRRSSKRIWIARPAPGGVGCDQILPVSWDEITRGGATATNYQVLPGDRIFVAEDKMLAFASFVNKVTTPFERAFGFTLLGAQTIQTLNRFPLGIPGGGGGGF